MARIVFDVGIASGPDQIVEALKTKEGIAGWWTDDVTFAGGIGSHMKLSFPVAPVPLELRVDEVNVSRVVWCSVGTFPPHWVDCVFGGRDGR